jgi:hypothetical protein
VRTKQRIRSVHRQDARVSSIGCRHMHARMHDCAASVESDEWRCARAHVVFVSVQSHFLYKYRVYSTYICRQ